MHHMKGTMKRPNIQIKENIYWAAKAEADAKKISLSELIENALVFWLSRVDKPKQAKP